MYMTVAIWAGIWLVVFGAIAAGGWMMRHRRPAVERRDDIARRHRNRAA